jgi:hypothetical protein
LNAKSTDISLIALTTSAHSVLRQQMQNKMINNFHNHFDGTSFIDYLLIDKYEDNNYCECDICYNYEFYEIFVRNPKNKKKEIIFYSPITDLYGTHNAKARIIAKDTANGFFWKIKPTFIENGTFMKFKKDKDSEYEERYFFNSHYEENTKNLFLDLKLDAQCNVDNLKFLTIIDSGSIYSNEYKMKIKKVFIEEHYKPILNKLIVLFCILLFIVLVAGEILFIVDFIDYTQQSTRKGRSSWIVGILLLMALLGFIFCFVYGTCIFYLIEIEIEIVLMFIGKIICLIKCIRQRNAI